MSSIAFVTHDAQPGLTADDQLAADELQRAGVAVEAVPWNDPRADWGAYSAVVLRSCWDYHLRHAEFRRWVREVEGRGGAIVNPARSVLWNSDKRYLREMEAHGAEIVPTEWVEPGASAGLAGILARRGWDRAVVKPAVSALAHRTHLVTRASAGADDPWAREHSGVDGTLVQPFVDEIVSEGEWSLLFFGGRFSHAVIKRPRAGDFRVQSTFGGSVEPSVPPPHVAEAAERVVRLAEERTGAPLSFARVDGVVVDHRFLLMELELIEPALFLEAHADAPALFAAALLDRQPSFRLAGV